MKAEIQIENLKCGGCAATIKKGLLSLPSVEDVKVNTDNNTVNVTATNNNLQEVKDKLAKLGYPETGSNNTIVHKAKSFVSCAVGRIES